MVNRIRHEFVKFIPSDEDLESGVLYVSIKYRTCTHICACGCNRKVVTPIRPTGWKLIFDGENISLWPSIGSWSLPCESHYWIREGKIVKAEKWSDERISFNREYDSWNREKYHDMKSSGFWPEEE